MTEPNLKKFTQAIADCEPIKLSGKITQIIGLVIVIEIGRASCRERV